MRNRTHIIAALIATLACASDSIVGVRHLVAPAGAQAAAAGQLAGFVELYGEGDVRLLTGGIEVQLFGAIDAVAAYGGRHVVVTGRFFAQNHFWVKSVLATDEVSHRGTRPVPGKTREQLSLHQAR